MTVQYAFSFDSGSCSGCKTCQVACKDKNDLEVGTLWRRVYEVSGGDWVKEGNTWTPDVFAYNVSMSCNHCQDPICAEVCPTKAMHKREDGIVLIDESKCVGCGYCAWACPYDAPKLDDKKGKMTKCNFCYDDIDQGKGPACVEACPLRVLGFGDLEKLESEHGDIHGVFPLPNESLTNPAIVITPHKDAHRAATEPTQTANREEV
jgi:anaerobic dimethyl sulfoxide reductase subunit B (iron-sulfur subunit)